MLLALSYQIKLRCNTVHIHYVKLSVYHLNSMALTDTNEAASDSDDNEDSTDQVTHSNHSKQSQKTQDAVNGKRA